jgi:hypothetical protein
MKKAILTLFAIVITISAIAQAGTWQSHKDTPTFDRGMSLTLVIPSFMTSSHSNLSPLLVENGYPHIPRSSLNYGLGLTYRMKRFEPGFDFSVGNQVVSNEALNSQLLRRPLTANIFLHYHLFRKGSFTLFPLVGYSFTDTNLIVSKKSSSNDLNDLLRNPGTSMNLQHLSDGVLVGFGVALAQHWVESTGTFRLKFAYRVPSGAYPWESSFANFNNAPNDSFPYFFIQLEMGALANWKKGDPWMDRY